MSGMTIGKAAKAAGVGVETIRFYERQGLLERPVRPAQGGFRIYSADTVRRIRFIRQAQGLGFSLREAGELLGLRTETTASASTVKERATAKLRDIDHKIEQLSQIRQALREVIDACPGRGPLTCCSIMEALDQAAQETDSSNGGNPS